MKLSKKQRDEVIELLRCAADLQRTITTTWAMQGYDTAVYDAATTAKLYVMDELRVGWTSWLDYRDLCLEAAVLVEEGTLP